MPLADRADALRDRQAGGLSRPQHRRRFRLGGASSDGRSLQGLSRDALRPSYVGRDRNLLRPAARAVVAHAQHPRPHYGRRAGLHLLHARQGGTAPLHHRFRPAGGHDSRLFPACAARTAAALHAIV